MSAPFTNLEIHPDRLADVCRGCLAESGEMKNIYDWGYSNDFFILTAIESSRLAGLPEVLCSTCEDTLNTCRQFREMCQQSDKKLRTSLKKKKLEQKVKRNQVTCMLHDKRLVIMITAPNTESKIHLPCPFHCTDHFLKKSHLHSHLKNSHDTSDDFQIDLQYYCAEATCAYHVASAKKKWFSGRKFLNQHQNKIHKPKTFNCNNCSNSFPTETEFHRHAKTCSFVYICQMCDVRYNSNEKLMVHLLRKHPDVHKMYKNERKAEKRKLSSETDANIRTKVATQTQTTPATKISDDKRTETTVQLWLLPETELESKQDKPMPKRDEYCDSPKKSFATQIPEDIKNDVTLPSWQSKNDLETKTDEISTQTVFEHLSQHSEDEIFFSEAVSLSDIQTQTFPLEFGLSRSHKETQSCKNSQTQSPDLSIKETQTCFCHYDSPKPNFRLFDSLSSSPASINLTSTETQTADRFSVKSDVLIGSYNSAETQTCFDDSSNDSM